MKITDTNVLLLVSAGFDLTQATGLELKIQRPGDGVFVADPTHVQVGTKARYFTLATLEPGQYVEYTLQPGDVTTVGPYVCQLTYYGPNPGPFIAHSTFIVDSA